MTPIKLDNTESSSGVVDIVVVVTPLRINKTDSLTVDTLTHQPQRKHRHHTIKFIVQ